MARGTYLPCPKQFGMWSELASLVGTEMSTRWVMKHTGLGEEGAESMVGLGGLALLGEETIGLSDGFVRI